MSIRQIERAERIYQHWAPRLTNTTGVQRLIHAVDYARARINDIPADQRAQASEALADNIVAWIDQLTDSEVRIRTSHKPGRLPRALRAQARRGGARAGARGTA